ncbi:MAG: hypothetical protein KatS3mg019_0148 [Fimbriimonadales bacterium]|nr:MAG: hypothetical protein KatS3mg019_0148 [Fimbriimonadales bacterium]
MFLRLGDRASAIPRFPEAHSLAHSELLRTIYYPIAAKKVKGFRGCSKNQDVCGGTHTPTQRNPVAWTVVSKRFPHAGTRLSLRRPSPWLGQSCPSVSSCRDKTVPATNPPRGLDSPVQAFPPCRDKTVPATNPPVAWTVLSKRFPHAGTRLSLLRWLTVARQPLRRPSPWLGQSCPSVSPMQGQSCPCNAIFRTPSGEWRLFEKNFLQGGDTSICPYRGRRL